MWIRTNLLEYKMAKGWLWGGLGVLCSLDETSPVSACLMSHCIAEHPTI